MLYPFLCIITTSNPQKDEITWAETIKYEATKVTRKVDFDDEKFEAQHDFTQTIVFMGVEKETENDKPTGRFIVSAKIVTYSTIEDVMFVIDNAKLANMFKIKLKPYTAINVWGKIDATTLTEEVESDDLWGETNKMNKVSTPTRRELIITGADPKTIDTTIYTQAEMENAMIKIKNAILT